MDHLYRYTADGEGIFSAGKRLLPEELVEEAREARAWLTKPDLAPSDGYRFYMTAKGKEQYEKTLLHVHRKYLKNIKVEELSMETVRATGPTVYEDEYQVVIMTHPFTSFSESEFKIIEVKRCTKEFLFHSSGKKMEVLDPSFNKKHEAYGSVHEYGVPVVFASDTPSNAFCYEPTELYAKTIKEQGTSVYHRLSHENHKILLGTHLKGYIYVLKGSDFYEVIREDFEVGEWVRSTEWISSQKVTPIETIEITQPYDWEMIPDYEFLGSEYVGNMPAEKYLSLATEDTVKKVIEECISKPFVPFVPEALKKYL